jgi:xylonate dehydratase
VGPEALQGGPIGRVRDDDTIVISIDRATLDARIDVTNVTDDELRARPLHPALAPHPSLPADTRLWAALQRASGGTWGGCVYDVDRIVALLDAGMRATADASVEGASQDHTRLTGAAS